MITATRVNPNEFMRFFVNTTLLGLGCAGLAYYSILLIERYQQYRLDQKESTKEKEVAEVEIEPLMSFKENKRISDSGMASCDHYRDIIDSTYV